MFTAAPPSPVLLCYSVTKSCLTLQDPMDCSMPAFPVLNVSRSLLKLMSIESVMPSNHLILCRPLLLPSIFPSIRLFPMSQLFASGGQIIGASASAPVPPMNIQDLFPLGLTGLTSFLSKGLSRVFSNKSISSSVLRFLYGPTLTLYMTTGKIIALTRVSCLGWS